MAQRHSVFIADMLAFGRAKLPAAVLAYESSVDPSYRDSCLAALFRHLLNCEPSQLEPMVVRHAEALKSLARAIRGVMGYPVAPMSFAEWVDAICALEGVCTRSQETQNGQIQTIGTIASQAAAIPDAARSQKRHGDRPHLQRRQPGIFDNSSQA